MNNPTLQSQLMRVPANTGRSVAAPDYRPVSRPVRGFLSPRPALSGPARGTGRAKLTKNQPVSNQVVAGHESQGAPAPAAARKADPAWGRWCW